MYCMKCGSEIKEDQSFCTKCGAKVEKIRYESTPSQNDDITDDFQTESEMELTEGETEVLQSEEYHEEHEIMEEPDSAAIKPKKAGKKTVVTLSVVLCLLMLIVGGVLAYRQMPMVRYRRTIRLAQKYIADGDYEQAILAIKEAIGIEPKEMDAYMLLADAFEETGNHEDAVNTVEIALNYLFQRIQRVGSVGMC